jgi:hypothetical protein
MKNLLKSLALTLLVTVSLVSCSKDDDGVSTSGELLGKWEYSKTGIAVNGQEQLENYEHQAGCSKDFVEFTATDLIDTDYFGSNCTEFTDSNPYTRSGNTISSGGESATIVQLDNATLKVKGTYTDNGITYNFITVYTRKTN